MWAGSITVAVGRLRVGVRSSSGPLRSGLLHALQAHVVEDADAHPNYSVRLAEQAGHFHFLYWGGRTVLRTLDPERLLQGLFTHLAAHRDPPPGWLRASALVVVREKTALLLPAWLRHELAHLEPLLIRRRFAVADIPWADIDLATAEVVVPAPALPVDHQPLEAILAATPRRRREPVVAPGPYAIAAWSFLGPPVEDGLLGRAESTLRAAALSSPRVTGATLAALGELFATVPGRSFSGDTPTAILDGLESLIADFVMGGRR